MQKLADAIRLKLNELWDKHHYTRWVTGVCSTCSWDEQSLDSDEYSNLMDEMDVWIKETYGDK